MPKKTYKEKLISQYRKKLKLLEMQKNVNEPLPQEKKQIQTQIPKPIPYKQYEMNEEEKRTKSFFIVDFKKSIFIIGFVLALEISLYFVSMYTNLRLGG